MKRYQKHKSRRMKRKRSPRNRGGSRETEEQDQDNENSGGIESGSSLRNRGGDRETEEQDHERNHSSKEEEALVGGRAASNLSKRRSPRKRRSGRKTEEQYQDQEKHRSSMEKEALLGGFAAPNLSDVMESHQKENSGEVKQRTELRNRGGDRKTEEHDQDQEKHHSSEEKEALIGESVAPNQDGSTSNLPWLPILLGEKSFFSPCPVHKSVKNNDTRFFCLKCCISLCHHCLPPHFNHDYLQIRRNLRRNVLLLKDVEKWIDCSHVQIYKTNEREAVVLNKRPSSSPFKAADNFCATCNRRLEKPNLFCSIACKVHVHPAVSPVPCQPTCLTESTESKVTETKETESRATETKETESKATETKGRKKPRKGVPHRSWLK